MIKVTKHGKYNPEEERQGLCEHCACDFTYTREDCWWSRPLLTYVCKCPECGKDVWLGDVFEN